MLRRNGTTEWLDPTAYPLGMFDHWEGVARETELEGGDVVALYTDGVSEALHVSGKEFGAEGVVETLRAQESAGAQAVLDRAIKAVLDFTQGEQHDDITMLVATVA